MPSDLDHRDLEALDHMVQLLAWQIYRARLEHMRDQAGAAALAANTWYEFLEHRKEFKTISRILELPNILREEAKSAAKQS